MIKKNSKGGFSLVELIVAICVLAALVAFLVPSYLSARNNARIKKDTIKFESMCTAFKTALGDPEVQKEAEELGFSGKMTYMAQIGISENGTLDIDNAWLVCCNTKQLKKSALWSNSYQSIDEQYVVENKEWHGKTITFYLYAKTSNSTARCEYKIH